MTIMMYNLTPHGRAAAGRPHAPRLHRPFQAVLWPFRWIFGLMLAARERAAQRRAMEMLDDHMLRDIGLRRSDLRAGITRPFRHY